MTDKPMPLYVTMPKSDAVKPARVYVTVKNSDAMSEELKRKKYNYEMLRMLRSLLAQCERSIKDTVMADQFCFDDANYDRDRIEGIRALVVGLIERVRSR
jgi:hypothetical protein